MTKKKPGKRGISRVVPWYRYTMCLYDAQNAGSFDASLLDLSGKGRHLTSDAPPGWANGFGWTFNGTNQYLESKG